LGDGALSPGAGMAEEGAPFIAVLPAQEHELPEPPKLANPEAAETEAKANPRSKRTKSRKTDAKTGRGKTERDKPAAEKHKRRKTGR
jgi:hypothetical protein